MVLEFSFYYFGCIDSFSGRLDEERGIKDEFCVFVYEILIVVNVDEIIRGSLVRREGV